MTDRKQLTTAAALLEFRKELIEGGMDQAEAHDLVCKAAVPMLEVGLVVRDEVSPGVGSDIRINIETSSLDELSAELQRGVDGYRRRILDAAR